MGLNMPLLKVMTFETRLLAAAGNQFPMTKHVVMMGVVAELNAEFGDELGL